MKLGTFLCLGCPAICEALGAKLDLAVIDAEHSVPLDNNLVNMLRALSCAVEPWVRVKTPDTTGTALDLGAKAVLVPQIRSMDDVNRAVDSFYYPPRGHRGWGPGRSSRYGADLMGPIKNEDQNELWLQIETHGALGILEEVASTDGVTGLFVGPGDLSLSLGRPGEWGNPALWESIEQVFQETKKHQKKFGIFVADPAQVKHWEQSGADVVVIGSDTLFLLQGYTDFLKKVGRQ